MNYIVNKKTKEIHRANHLTKMCNVKVSNHTNTNWLGAMWRIWFMRYNSCHWCWNKFDKA